MRLEINQKFMEANTTFQMGTQAIMVTPPLDSDYWLFRVQVSDNQAVVGFPKFGTIGIGFQFEDEDWNTNLPYQCDTEEIYQHIADNGRDSRHADCLKAIKIIQDAAYQWQKFHAD